MSKNNSETQKKQNCESSSSPDSCYTARSEKCVLCGSEIHISHPRIGLENPICMPCEFSEIDVFEVELMPNSDRYIEKDLDGIKALLESADEDETYKITKMKMRATKYYSLPEFQGF